MFYFSICGFWHRYVHALSLVRIEVSLCERVSGARLEWMCWQGMTGLFKITDSYIYAWCIQTRSKKKNWRIQCHSSIYPFISRCSNASIILRLPIPLHWKAFEDYPAFRNWTQYIQIAVALRRDLRISKLDQTRRATSRDVYSSGDSTDGQQHWSSYLEFHLWQWQRGFWRRERQALWWWIENT